MRRRAFLFLGAALFSWGARAQPPAAFPRVGLLAVGFGPSSPLIHAFRQALAELGHVEGQNIAIEYRFALGRAWRLPTMANDLVELKVNLIVTDSARAAEAVSKAAKAMPVVMAAGAERPARQLELLKEAVPSASSVAVLHTPTRPGIQQELKDVAETARALGLEIQLVEVRNRDHLDKAFDTVTSAAPSAIVIVADGLFLTNSRRIVDFTLKARLPAVFPEREFADAGGLMAYGPDLTWNLRRAASSIDRVLKGAKPAELPPEQAKWGLVVNLRTANALGLEIPAPVLARADELIR
jgi:putative tryptophan/tyrosine transport system substrate-binding protein